MTRTEIDTRTDPTPLESLVGRRAVARTFDGERVGVLEMPTHRWGGGMMVVRFDDGQWAHAGIVITLVDDEEEPETGATYYVTRDEAIEREIVAAIEATGEAKAADYDVEKIADEVLASSERGWRFVCASGNFWAVVADAVKVDRAAVARRVRDEILSDMADGTVPSTVRSFQALHDYVDANTYGGLDETPIADANAITDEVDAWLAQGAHPLVAGDRFEMVDERGYVENGVRGVHRYTLLCEVESASAKSFQWRTVEVLSETGRPETLRAVGAAQQGETSWRGYRYAVVRGEIRPA